MCSTPTEGEVIFKEHFGSSGKERFYVKPPDQNNVVLINVGSQGKMSNIFTRIFLPEGYPESVSKDYLAYQTWDTAQAFCSTITGILATQEVLRGVGVGDQNATPLAATITWVLKDGCGHIGRILFAYTHGKYLDAYSKKWRMYADILNDAAMCIEIALPYFKVYSLFALCVSTVMKAVVGVAGGATRVAMTQHHAVLGNLADVSAKDAAQETAVNLVASLASLAIISWFGSSLVIFMLMMVLHVTFNYFAVRAVCLRTLNEPRLLLVIDKYLRQERVATPCEVNRIEPVIFYQMGPCILDLKMCGFKITLGSSICEVFKGCMSVERLSRARDIYSEGGYILVPKIERRSMHVLMKDGATGDDVLCGYFHATLLAIAICAINDEPLAIYKNQDPRPFAQVCATLQSVEWSREEAMLPGSQFAYEPSADLLTYLDRVVAKEWPRVRNGLQQTGWDLSKHLIIVDQWRISRDEFATKEVSPETSHLSSDLTNDLNMKVHYQRYPIIDDHIKETLLPYSSVHENIKESNALSQNNEVSVQNSERTESSALNKNVD